MDEWMNEGIQDTILFYFLELSFFFIHAIIESLGGFTKSPSAPCSIRFGDPPLEIGFSVIA